MCGLRGECRSEPDCRDFVSCIGSLRAEAAQNLIVVNVRRVWGACAENAGQNLIVANVCCVWGLARKMRRHGQNVERKGILAGDRANHL